MRALREFIYRAFASVARCSRHRLTMNVHALRISAAVCYLLSVTSCAALPDTDALIANQGGQTGRFENASGPLSTQRNAAVLSELKRKSGDIDILGKQIALERAIVGSPLILGNKVTLLQDGAATYSAMFAAIRKAQLIPLLSRSALKVFRISMFPNLRFSSERTAAFLCVENGPLALSNIVVWPA